MTKSIIVAIDETNKASFINILDSLDSNLCMVKIGSVSFNALGHDIIHLAAEKGFDIFLDLKLHDIPNTVKKSIEGLSTLPIKMLTIHSSGGRLMMESAMEALKGTDIKVFGVTALTSLSDIESSLLKQFPELSKGQITKSIDAIIDSIVEAVAQDDKVEIRGFGTFSKKYIRPRRFVNPKTKEVSYLGETATMHFKPSKSLLEK